MSGCLRNEIGAVFHEYVSDGDLPSHFGHVGVKSMASAAALLNLFSHEVFHPYYSMEFSVRFRQLLVATGTAVSFSQLRVRSDLPKFHISSQIQSPLSKVHKNQGIRSRREPY